MKFSIKLEKGVSLFPKNGGCENNCISSELLRLFKKFQKNKNKLDAEKIVELPLILDHFLDTPPPLSPKMTSKSLN